MWSRIQKQRVRVKIVFSTGFTKGKCVWICVPESRDSICGPRRRLEVLGNTCFKKSAISFICALRVTSASRICLRSLTHLSYRLCSFIRPLLFRRFFRRIRGGLWHRCLCLRRLRGAACTFLKFLP